MTKKDAVLQISKLYRLAAKAGTSQEAASARRVADELKRKHGITEKELMVGSSAAAFDDLAGKLHAYTLKKPDLPPAVFEVIQKLKSDMSEDEKAKALEKLVAAIRIASLLLGRGLGNVKTIMEETLRSHDVTI